MSLPKERQRDSLLYSSFHPITASSATDPAKTFNDAAWKWCSTGSGCITKCGLQDIAKMEAGIRVINFNWGLQESIFWPKPFLICSPSLNFEPLYSSCFSAYTFFVIEDSEIEDYRTDFRPKNRGPKQRH